MPRSRTRARARPPRQDDPAWSKARIAQLYREVDRRLKRLYADKERSAQAQQAAQAQPSPAGPAAREEPCDAAGITPSMPR